MTTTTAPAARLIVRVGHTGTATHYGYGADATHQAFTSCGAERRHLGVGAVREVVGATDVTCRACNPTGERTARPATAPAECPTHPRNAAYAPKTVKAGTYVGFPCGCKVWTA